MEGHAAPRTDGATLSPQGIGSVGDRQSIVDMWEWRNWHTRWSQTPLFTSSTLVSHTLLWWNGRHTGFKIRWGNPVTVRVCQVAPILYASMAEMLDRFRAKKTQGCYPRQTGKSECRGRSYCLHHRGNRANERTPSVERQAKLRNVRLAVNLKPPLCEGSSTIEQRGCVQS